MLPTMAPYRQGLARSSEVPARVAEYWLRVGWMATNDIGWYSVRCIFRAKWADAFEERITMWQAESFEGAIESAETEAREYAETCELEYTGTAQAYRPDLEEGLANGVEIFSLFRDSDLASDGYVNRFFDTGREHQADVRTKD